MALMDLTGQRFGRLLVIGEGERQGPRKHARHWICLCDCGKTKEVFHGALQSGVSRSCGCISTERINKYNWKHGLTNTLEYPVWYDMIRRCEGGGTAGKKYYQDRGITVCDRWKGSDGMKNFLADMGPRPSLEYSLDRVDNDGNYEPGNCRWATREEQMGNSRCAKKIEYKGETLSLSAWARRTGLSLGGIRKRLELGWSIERTLTEPPNSLYQRPRR